MKWTKPEMDKLKLLAKKGLAHDEIAKVCLSSVAESRLQNVPFFLVSD